MNQGDRDYFENRENNGFSHLNVYKSDLIISRIKSIIKGTKIKSGDFVLDFGCAKGFYVKGFEEEGFSAIGYDVSQYAVNLANNLMKKEIAFSDFEKIKQIGSKRKFDLVLMKDTAEHIPESDLNNYLEDLGQISKEVLVIVPVTEMFGKSCPDLYKDETHINMHSDAYWEEYLGKYGLVKNLPKLTQDLKKEYATICCSFLLSY